MSTQTNRSTTFTPETRSSMVRKAEQELAEGFVEVEITGLSFRRLVSIYSVLLRQAWLGSVRTLMRADAAHQA